MTINKVISAVVLALTAVLLHQTTQVNAQCACPKIYYYPSDYAKMGAVVLRAKILSRSPEADVDGDITYKVRPTTVYAGEPDVEYGNRIYFTSASTDDCGVDLKIRGDYLLSLFRTTTKSSTSDSDQGGALTLHACDLNKLWRDVGDGEKEDLASLLEDDDYE